MKSLRDRIIDRLRPGHTQAEYEAILLEEIHRTVDYAEYIRDVQTERREGNAIHRPNK